MATPQRRPQPSLEAKFFAQPYEFDFHQAVRILEWLKPGCTPIGEGDNPKNEAMIFQSRVTLSSSSSDIYSLKSNYQHPDRPIMTVNFLGLGGIQGPLPTPYTELLIDRLRQKDTAMADFLDIFNHRLISFWHRVRKKVVLGIAQIPPEQTGMGKCLLNLMGIDGALEKKTYPVPLRSLIKYAPLFWQRPRSLGGLLTILRGYFPHKITIKPFEGGWNQAIDNDLSRIGSKGQYNRLGQSLVLGRRTWDEAQGITIHLHHLHWLDFVSYLPGGRGHKALKFLCELYCEPTLKIKLKATLQPQTIPPSRLGKKHFLGCTTFLTRGQSKGFTNPPEVTIL